MIARHLKQLKEKKKKKKDDEVITSGESLPKTITVIMTIMKSFRCCARWDLLIADTTSIRGK